MTDQKITQLIAATSVDASTDVLPVVDVSDNQTKKITRNSLLGIVGNPVGDTDTATLTNKTITAPAISSPVLSGTVSGTYTIGGTPTFPSAVVTLTGSQTLTNKVLTSPTINTATIVNPTLTTDTVNEYTSANGVSVDGLNIKDSKLNTNDSVVTTNVTDSAITPQKLLAGTGSSWPWQSWTPTWTNLTVGNATVVAKYKQTGKTVDFRVNLIFGSTSSISGSVALTLPVTALAYGNTGTGAFPLVGIVRYEDIGVNGYAGVIDMNSTTTIRPLVPNASATFLTLNATTSTIPFTWGTGDEMTLTGSYEAT